MRRDESSALAPSDHPPAANVGAASGDVRLTPLLAAREISCRRAGRLVFAGLSFALRRGDALLLRGPNGSGKSSLLRLVAGLSAPQCGDIEWAGASIAEDGAAHRARLHFIGHLDALKPVLTTGETLAFWSALRAAPRRGPTPAESLHALQKMGLGALAPLPCRLLSAGQKKRLALARLFAAPAALWLLDEPTNGLDAAGVRFIEAAIAAHRRAGGIVIATTHAEMLVEDAATLSPVDFAPDRRDAADAWDDVFA
jgi:heme exporter protein A